MEEIKVNEYVRTISGNIDKVDALCGMIENTIHLEKHKWQDIKNIVKHSPNIIDLIEVGDYVNGYLVLDKDFENEMICLLMPFNKENQSNYNLVWKTKYYIKSIVTKEMMESIEYKVGE